jgi:DNA end-binding protein Ku
MKAYWQGMLSCDFLTIPVKLYAVVTPHEPRFHYLHAQCRTPLEHIRQCPRCGTAVASDDVVRGYEYEDSLVLVNERDLATLPRTKEHVITVRQCIHAHEIDPICFDRAFYIEPGPGAKKAYALLQDALRQAGMVALGTASLREHDRVVVLRPAPGVLALHTLFAPEDMVSTERLALPQRPPHPAEVQATQERITRLAGKYVPEQWVDQAQVALSVLLAQKAKSSANRVPALHVRTRQKLAPPSHQAAA